jgi:aconitate hydratase 2/2-methylisocitrate dehydratase
MKEYMDFRDVVHATQSQMLHQFKGDNFPGVIEVHIGTLTADQSFFMNWTAEMKAKLLSVFLKTLL